MKAAYRRLIAPLVLLVILAVGIYVLWPRRVSAPKIGGGDPTHKVAPPVTALMLSQTDGLTIINHFGTFEFTREGEKWFIVSPVKGRANEGVVGKILSRLGSVKFGQVVTSDPKTYKKHLVTKNKAVTLELKSRGKSQVVLYFGRSRKFTLVRAADQKEVWNLKGALRQPMVKDVRDFVEPNIAPFTLKDVKEVSYLGPDKKVVYTFTKGSNAVYKPTFGTMPDGFFARNVTASVAKLLRLRVRKVNNDRGRKASYLSNSPGGVVLTLTNGKKYTYTIGNPDGKLVHVASSAVDWIPEVHAHALTGVLLLSPLDLVSRKVFAQDPAKITAIAALCKGFSYELAAQKKGGFKVVKSSVEFIPARARLVKFLEQVRKGHLRAEQIRLLLPPEKTQISEKSDFMTFTLEGGEKVTLRFGALTRAPAGDMVWQYVESSRNPKYTYIVRRERVDMICRTKARWQMAGSEMETIPATRARPMGSAPKAVPSKSGKGVQ